MPKIKQWVRKRLHHARTSKTSDAPELVPKLGLELPVLSTTRPRNLTPISSQYILTMDAAEIGPFFQKLPLELREEIYVAAFGNRVIHMDLLYGHEELPVVAGMHRHAERSRTQKPEPSPTWEWWGHVCHRHPSFEPSWDACERSSPGNFCTLYAGGLPRKCFIGIMGRLLACRQAYVQKLLFVLRLIHFLHIVMKRSGYWQHGGEGGGLYQVSDANFE